MISLLKELRFYSSNPIGKSIEKSRIYFSFFFFSFILPSESVKMRRRTRRGRMLSLGLLFIIYSAINVYSASDVANSSNSAADSEPIYSTISPKFTSISPTNDGDDIASVSPSSEPLASSTTTAQPAPVTEKGPYRTYRKRRENCTAPAIEQFPPTILPVWFRNHGGIIIHILIAIFTFLGLAIVCDDYFVSSLDRICEGNFFIFTLFLHQLERY